MEGWGRRVRGDKGRSGSPSFNVATAVRKGTSTRLGDRRGGRGVTL
jgi:hypothetical protein